MDNPGTLTGYLVRQAQNNRWANHRLHTVCAALNAEEYFAERPSFFGSIHAHLDHIVTVDWLYLQRLTARSYLPEDLGDLLHSALAQLTADQAKADLVLIDFCLAANSETLERPVSFHLMDGRAMTETVVNVLAHLFQHQIHHRGQVHALLSATAVAPPQLDEFFLDGDAPLRAAEMEALGLPPD